MLDVQKINVSEKVNLKLLAMSSTSVVVVQKDQKVEARVRNKVGRLVGWRKINREKEKERERKKVVIER